MKELSIEEKAKRYDEAIKKLRSLHDNYDTVSTLIDVKEELEDIFPELKESEDERMIRYFKDLAPFDKAEELYEKYGFSHKDAIAWFEKQGEHANFRNKIQIGDKVTRNEDGVLVNLSQLERVAKPADKVEVKFKVGDWVIYCSKPYQITGLHNDTFTLTSCDGSYFFNNVKSTKEPVFHLWTIQDAKDGDVLHCWIDGDEFILIYKGIKDGYITTYGHLYQRFKLFAEEPTTMFCRTIQGYFTPATKEQRDTLMKAMTDAGYTFDFDKKELKKIEQKPVEWSEKTKIPCVALLMLLIV